MAYPPLIIFSHVGLLIHACKNIIKSYSQRRRDSDISSVETIQEERTSLLSVFSKIIYIHRK
jgi:hypothetical protein